jgi:hypothetical protein
MQRFPTNHERDLPFLLRFHPAHPFVPRRCSFSYLSPTHPLPTGRRPCVLLRLLLLLLRRSRSSSRSDRCAAAAADSALPPSAIRFTSLATLAFKIATTVSAPSRLVRKVKRVFVLQAMRTHVRILRECRLEWGVELADSLGRPVAAHARDPQPVTLAPDLVRMRGVV